MFSCHYSFWCLNIFENNNLKEKEKNSMTNLDRDNKYKEKHDCLKS